MLSDRLKTALRTHGKPIAQIAKESGVSRSALMRFLAEDESQHRDIRLEASADRLADYLGLELQPTAKAASKASKRTKKAAKGK